ncbi:hypothetical protein [Desulfosporosinus hippei]|uniref:hypothetical protein n=1 Tax=Desulfosporosinus hippei TaxID=569859 RepID=UPI000B890716|nr:hypothetical protein [Desulfosporosinus hippei]
MFKNRSHMNYQKNRQNHHRFGQHGFDKQYFHSKANTEGQASPASSSQCPLCKNSCPLTALSCERGEAYSQSLVNESKG